MDKTLFISSLLVIFYLGRGRGSKTIEEMIESLKTKRINNLTCHVCHSETQPECFNFTESWDDSSFQGFPQQCPQDKPICVARKFAFTLSNATGTGAMKTFAMKRNCTDKCENECVVMGERTRIYVCNQCCTTPLCNVGNHAIRLQTSNLFIITFLSFCQIRVFR